MMHCYFCDNNVELVIKNMLSCEYCFNCKLTYIKRSNLQSYIRYYLENNIKQVKNISEVEKDLNLNLYENKFKIKDEQQCKNKCRKKCSIVKYQYQNLSFWYCNFTEYYIFKKEDLEKFIKRSIRINCIKYYLRYIRNRVKALFIKEGE